MYKDIIDLLLYLSQNMYSGTVYLNVLLYVNVNCNVMSRPSRINLYDLTGKRKYLISKERKRFYEVSLSREMSKRLFLLMLFYSGARISEVLNLEVEQIDFDQNVVVLECLKKRRKGIYRVVPLPKSFLNELKILIEFYELKMRLWTFTRRSASRYVKSAMTEGDIFGTQACAKGLRHSFAVSAVEKNIPINLIKKWMGHSSIETTAIYLNVSGNEERRFARKLWS